MVKKMNIFQWMTAAATASAVAFLGTGCILGGNGGGFDCSAQEASFEDTAAAQGILQESVPVDGPFPMAMVLSTDAVNTLLAKVLDQALPEVPEGNLMGLGTLQLQPELPTVEITSMDGCPGCIKANWDFGAALSTILGDLDGAASISMALPVGLAPISNTSTALMANLDEAEVINLSLDIAGLRTSDIAIVEELIENLATRYIREEVGAIEVVQLDSWQLGDDDMLLAARGPMIFPEQGTLVLGLHSNLKLSNTASVEEQAALPDGAQIGLQIHPELLLSVAQRMMGVGIIERDYDASGNIDSGGDHQVTLDAMSTSDGSDKMKTSFTIFRTGGGLCGQATVSSDMGLRINSDFVEMTAENFQITSGEGIGELLQDASMEWLGNDFMNNLTEQLALTVNYREFGIEEDKGDVAPRANEVRIDGRGLSVFLDID